MALFGWIIVIGTVLLGIAIVMSNSSIFSTNLSETDFTDNKQEISTKQIAFLIHKEVNEVRKLHELKTLSWSSTISEIAKKHSLDMSERRHLSHFSPEGKDVADRYEQANFACNKKLSNGEVLKGGENLAQVSYPEDLRGIGTRIVQSWMDSPSHRENLLFDGYSMEGIGIVISGDVIYITQNFC